MLKAWMYAQGKTYKSVLLQEEALTDYCCQNGIEKVGVTNSIGEDDSGFSVRMALKEAKEHECDCLMVQNANILRANFGTYKKMMEAYVQDNLTVYALDDGDIFKAIFDFQPLLRLHFSPELLSIDDALEDGEVFDYPEKRELDSVQVRVNRNGETQTVSFTDLTRDERNFAINSLPEEGLKELCKQPAENLRYIGDAFGIEHNEQGEMYATTVKVVEISGTMTEHTTD